MARTAYHHGDLPRAVMAAALEELEAGDRFAVNFNQIARRLGVSHAAVYRHFPNKQALIDALAAAGFDQLRAALTISLEPLTDTRDRILALARTHVRFTLDHPMQTRIMFSGAAADRHRDPALKAAAYSTIMILQGEVARAAGEGWVAADEVFDVTRFFWAGMHGIAMLRIESQFDGMLGSDEEFDQLVERAATWLARGVRP